MRRGPLDARRGPAYLFLGASCARRSLGGGLSHGGAAAEQFASSAEQGVEIPAQITYTYWFAADQLPRKLAIAVF